MVGETTLTDDEVESVLENALADELGVHVSTIDVEFTGESGEVTYVISSDDAESLISATEILASESFRVDLTTVDGVTITSVSTPSDVVATVDVIVDASSVADVDSAVEEVTIQLADDGDVRSDGILFLYDIIIMLCFECHL